MKEETYAGKRARKGDKGEGASERVGGRVGKRGRNGGLEEG